MKNISKSGFTLIELMIVVAIIAFLSMIAIPSFSKFLAKSKRAEAYLNLSALCTAEKAYFAENGRYTNVLYGANGAGWKPSDNCQYTYGFGGGSPGQSCFIGKLGAQPSDLRGSSASDNGFVAVAAADIAGSGVLDIISINQDNKIEVVQDALAG